MKYINLVFFISYCCFATMAQQGPSGIKMLVKNKDTGVNLRDSLTVTINDSLKIRPAGDANGYLFLPLPAGKYDVMTAHAGYQSVVTRGILVREGGTSYLTVSLENNQGIKIKQKKKKRKKTDTPE